MHYLLIGIAGSLGPLGSLFLLWVGNIGIDVAGKAKA
jgi:hypothetical protein